MSTRQTHMAEAQKKAEPVRQLEQKPGLQRAQLPVQAVAPHAAYRRAQVSGNGLTPTDLLAMQRTVGNRQVQRMAARRVNSANDQQPIQRAPEEESQVHPPQSQTLKVVLYQSGSGADFQNFQRQANRIASAINASKV